jgi:hypothetical protein
MASEEDNETWRRYCQQALDTPGLRDLRIDAAKRLLGVARLLEGVGCEACSGQGERVYGNTTGWRGGYGGQAMTTDTCDRCWGTGGNDRTGPDLRKLASGFNAGIEAAAAKAAELAAGEYKDERVLRGTVSGVAEAIRALRVPT